METESRLQLAIRAACEVAADQELTFERAIVLQHRSNAVVDLYATTVVARVATTTSTVRQGDHWFASEVAVAAERQARLEQQLAWLKQREERS